MFLDTNLFFWHSGSVYAFTSGEYVSLATFTTTTGSSVINLGAARDLGIGDGERPKVALFVGTGITSGSASMTLNFQFQGSTDSTNWTTYMETGANTTASYTANTYVSMVVPPRPAGVALPTYYRLQMAVAGTSGAPTITAGTVLAGIVLEAEENMSGIGQYASGFTVV